MTAHRTIQFRRKREQKTNYRKRIGLLKSGLPRLVVRKTLNNTSAQLVQYNKGGDKVLFTATAKELEKYGWKANKGNVVSAYLVGLLIGKKALGKVKKAVLDTGLYPSVKGSRIFAVLKGCLDAGIDIPHSPEILPSQDRIAGKHIEAYAGTGKFTKYDPKNISKDFAEVKSRIAKQ